ncbi:thiamine-phosphate kinase [Alteribacillus persepolensis]|uniref:Thiamine-monophosphate kinase n=1 Tax=Alteribacillus persepolensis TaxID=568899 RepID=A0A1G8J767_9BACI|nr:thiamine-phosphate kinase [Alteribacillus persepolensis]SDI26490.1 thiamine-phosphate kinase [Alteribacillus persepolensis]
MPNDEFQWIQQLTPDRHVQKHVIEGIGDDAAVFGTESGYYQLLCVDTMIENVHFKKKTMSPEDIGHKALAANISDIAAMGGIPVFYVVSIAVPSTWTDEELHGIYKGMSNIADTYQMDMIGGDTVSSPHELMVSITVYGKVEQDASLVRRNARPGDYVFLTSPTGRSAAGLELLLKKGRLSDFNDREKALIACHQRPIPHVQAGRAAAQTKARIALNDISDGLASEAFELAEASNVILELYKDQIPIAAELRLYSEKDCWNWILYGGEDFVLLGTVSPSDWPRLQEAMKQQSIETYWIGEVKEGSPHVMLTDQSHTKILQKSGYNHFRPT